LRRAKTPVLVGLLAAVLVGVSGATSRAEPRTVTGTIMIPQRLSCRWTVTTPGRHRTTTDSWGWERSGRRFEFPVPLVSVRRITLYAGDGSAVMNVCAHLYRSAPATGAFVETGFTCTVYPAPGDPQASFSTDISPRRVDTRLHGSFVLVDLYPSLSLYGVQITYAYEAGF